MYPFRKSVRRVLPRHKGDLSEWAHFWLNFHIFTLSRREATSLLMNRMLLAIYVRSITALIIIAVALQRDGNREWERERDSLEAVKIALFSDSQFFIVCMCVFVYVVICCEIFIVIGFMLDARVFMINFSKHIGLNSFTKRRKTSRIASMVNNSFNFVNMLATNAHHISTSKHSGSF